MSSAADERPPADTHPIAAAAAAADGAPAVSASRPAQPLAWLSAIRRDLSDVFSKPPQPAAQDGKSSASTEVKHVPELPGVHVMDVEEAVAESINASSSSYAQPADARDHWLKEQIASDMGKLEALPDVQDLAASATPPSSKPAGGASASATSPKLPQFHTPPHSPRAEDDDADVAEDLQADWKLDAAQGMEIAEVVLEAPWRIDDCSSDVPVSPDWPAVAQANSHNGQSGAATAWQCAVMRRVQMDDRTGAGKVWKRWVQKVENIAGNHVSQALRPVMAELHSVMSGPRRSGDSDVRAVLALAGADVADHEATMRQVEGIVRAEVANACVASVVPENFRNLAAVTRYICEQLMGGSNRLNPGSGIAKEAAEVVAAEESEWPEDVDARHMQKASLSGCLDWYRERQSRGIVGGVVLLVERMEAVPKDLLRDTLSCLGNAFGDEGIPIFLILGLQHPPQDCFDFLEGKPLVNMHMLHATRVFDSRKTSTEVLEWLLEDPMCMLVLPPNILDWLRRGVFEYERQSVSRIMKALALLCAHFYEDSPFGLLCVPLEVDTEGCKLSRETLEAAWCSIFQERLENASHMIPHLETMWKSCWGDLAEDRGAEALCSEVAQAAAQAACWRHRLIASFGVWDALMRSAQPMSRHEARLRRLCRLLEEVWPKESGHDAASFAAASAKEQAKVHDLVSKCIGNVSSAEFLPDKELLRLFEDVLEASSVLDVSLKSQLLELKTQAVEGDALRKGIEEWLYRVESLYWCPLEGAARLVFREVFTAKCAGRIHLKVETCLAGGKMGLSAQSALLPLASGCNSEDSPPGDITVLYRLIECSSCRSVEVADLWKNFCECMESPSSADEKAAKTARSVALKTRFGYGLLTLHAMGLIAPQTGGRTDSGTSFAGWRLRKRHFGRVWLKNADSSADADTIAALCSAAPTTAAELQLALRSDDVEPNEPKPLPAWAQRWLPGAMRGEGNYPSLLKRAAPARPAGFDPSAKRAKGVDKSRARIFMA